MVSGFWLLFSSENEIPVRLRIRNQRIALGSAGNVVTGLDAFHEEHVGQEWDPPLLPRRSGILAKLERSITR